MHALTLLYHDVVPAGHPEASGFQSPDADIYKFSVEEFDRHLATIAASVRAPLATMASSLALRGSGRPVLMTFDDGGASALHIADALEKRGWRGHFFITTGSIGTAGFLDATGLRDLRRRGHLVGSHSESHPARMSACTRAQLDREWADSIGRLTDILGERIDVASVPGGYYSRAVAASAARAGIRVLFNSEPVTRLHDVDGCLVVGRFGVQQGVPASWAAAVARGDRAPRLQRWVFWNGKKLLKRLGGERWLRVRRRLIAARAR
jgi:peptidoglycan/xylan/chitin deacetylase (PgdA/CDA1 family)